MKVVESLELVQEFFDVSATKGSYSCTHVEGVSRLVDGHNLSPGEEQDSRQPSHSKECEFEYGEHLAYGIDFGAEDGFHRARGTIGLLWMIS